MNSPTLGLRVAALFFGLFAALQLTRLILQPVVLVAGHLIPLWPSVLAFLIMSALCLWMLKLARNPG